jgi:hypothetical protein
MCVPASVCAHNSAERAERAIATMSLMPDRGRWGSAGRGQARKRTYILLVGGVIMCIFIVPACTVGGLQQCVDDVCRPHRLPCRAAVICQTNGRSIYTTWGVSSLEAAGRVAPFIHLLVGCQLPAASEDSIIHLRQRIKG